MLKTFDVCHFANDFIEISCRKKMEIAFLFVPLPQILIK